MEANGDMALRMVGITKRFPRVLANNNISLEVKAGEIHGLLGENGAGKSTLMKILYGLHQPDSGEIYLFGRKVEVSSPGVAVGLGIGMVHQHFMLVANLTALENVMLGLKQVGLPVLDIKKERARFEELTRQYQLDVDPMAPIWTLPVGNQQWVEILKLLFRDARLLVLDEPTGVLTPSQAQQLFHIMRQLAGEGRGIVLISHKLEEMMEVTDRITVLRDGNVIGTVVTRETTPAQLAHMMVGRPVFLNRRERPKIERKRPVLTMKDVSCNSDRNVPALKKFNLTINAGEIVGVAGVDGNGQRELAECIAGLRRPTDGGVEIYGKKVTDVVRDSSLLGFIPEDRHKTGLVLDFSVAENLVLKTISQKPFTQRGMIRWRKVRDNAQNAIKTRGIKASHEMAPARQLSGGNQQKVVIAREVEAEPALIVASQPTRGLDVGAVEGVHEILLKERERGAAVLFISTELSEVLALSDRIVVLFKGEIMGEMDAEAADVERIGQMMMGQRMGI